MSSREGEPGPVELGVEGDTVLPAAPGDRQPGAGKDANCVWVAASSVDGTFVDVSRPGSTRRLPLAKSMTARSFLLHDQRKTACSYFPD